MAAVSATASIREESATAALCHALEEVSEAMADPKKIENEMEVIFEKLRRAILEVGRAAAIGEEGASSRQVEEFWLFLFAVRKRYKSRRKRIAECIEVVGRSRRWASVVWSSPEVRAALDSMPELQAEFLALLPSASPVPAQQLAATNPWATAVQQGGPFAGVPAPPSSPGSNLDPWKRPDSGASATPGGSQQPSPWSSPTPPSAWPQGAPAGPFQPPQRQQIQPQPQPQPLQQQLAGAPVDPWGNVKGSTPTNIGVVAPSFLARQPMTSQPSNPFSSPVAADPAGGKGGATSFGDMLNAQTDQFQKKVARNAMNSAASQYTGGAIKKVPDGASDAALDYAKKNPQQAAKLASSAARFAGRVA